MFETLAQVGNTQQGEQELPPAVQQQQQQQQHPLQPPPTTPPLIKSERAWIPCESCTFPVLAKRYEKECGKCTLDLFDKDFYVSTLMKHTAASRDVGTIIATYLDGSEMIGNKFDVLEPCRERWYGATCVDVKRVDGPEGHFEVGLFAYDGWPDWKSEFVRLSSTRITQFGTWGGLSRDDEATASLSDAENEEDDDRPTTDRPRRSELIALRRELQFAKAKMWRL